MSYENSEWYRAASAGARHANQFLTSRFLVSTHQFSGLQGMTCECVLDLLPCRAGGKVERLRVDREQTEVVAMRAGGRTRAYVPELAAAVLPRHADGVGAAAARELGALGRNVEQHPVREGTVRRIGIVHDQRERSCVARRILPRERRRCVVAVAREGARDVAASGEGGARNRERHRTRSMR